MKIFYCKKKVHKWKHDKSDKLYILYQNFSGRKKIVKQLLYQIM